MNTVWHAVHTLVNCLVGVCNWDRRETKDAVCQKTHGCSQVQQFKCIIIALVSAFSIGKLLKYTVFGPQQFGTWEYERRYFPSSRLFSYCQEPFSVGPQMEWLGVGGSRGILFQVHPFVCLSVRLSAKSSLAFNLSFKQGIMCIFGMHTIWLKPFQMTSV